MRCSGCRTRGRRGADRRAEPDQWCKSAGWVRPRIISWRSTGLIFDPTGRLQLCRVCRRWRNSERWKPAPCSWQARYGGCAEPEERHRKQAGQGPPTNAVTNLLVHHRSMNDDSPVALCRYFVPDAAPVFHSGVDLPGGLNENRRFAKRSLIVLVWRIADDHLRRHAAGWRS